MEDCFLPSFPVPLPLQVFRKAFANASSWRCIRGVPFRGSLRGGESERGRNIGNLVEGPLTFGAYLGGVFSSFGVPRKECHED